MAGFGSIPMKGPSIMVIYGSATFVSRLKCQVSMPDQRPTQVPSPDGWSGDVLRVRGAAPVAVLMHDATLATLLIPLTGVRRFDDLLPRVLPRMGHLFPSSDFTNQDIVVLRRSNRRLIGSMNDAKRLAEAVVVDQRASGEPTDWNQAEDFINGTPFSILGYQTPTQALIAIQVVITCPLFSAERRGCRR